ncbi:LysR family transcriptional regulator [Phreatobacter sp. AB_2022a]|uniref:LysR family transcriptional regulator n=1 Tax=Phreatobacter sp. AB_2022a TaxID=3003134 RepID=UPI0022872DAA|nr:LysR family transcriptional regulator [Phreatobacter sp. AB_2022a]MCZ0732973.1 LysR family transcriptional regulator [Phreatobacter sp. AB_2022a]
MELRHLRTFVRVAEELHFGRAAEQLHIAQSAISQHIRLLEADVGVRLLDRSRHRVSLTEAGRVFLPEAQRTLAQAAAAARAARAAGTGAIGQLEFGFVDNAIWSRLSTVLRTFHGRYPGVALRLHQTDRVALIAGLAEGSLDVALVPAPLPAALPAPAIASEVLVAAPFLVALPRGHRLAGHARLSLAMLADEPFVLFPPQLQTRLGEIVLSACADAGFAPRIVQEARQVHTLLALVAAGFGITLVPEWVTAIQAADVVYRPVATVMPHYELRICFRAERTNAAVEAFRQVAAACVQGRLHGED